MKPRKAIRKVSKSRQKRLVEYAKVKREFLLSHRFCKACEAMLDFEDRQLHHQFGRAGRLLTWVPGFMCLCPNCHRLIHDEPNWATLNGYLGPTGTWNDYNRAVKYYEHQRTT